LSALILVSTDAKKPHAIEGRETGREGTKIFAEGKRDQHPEGNHEKTHPDSEGLDAVPLATSEDRVVGVEVAEDELAQANGQENDNQHQRILDQFQSSIEKLRYLATSDDPSSTALPNPLQHCAERTNVAAQDPFEEERYDEHSGEHGNI
jgi:hypothetical protein